MAREIGEKNYWALEEFQDLISRTFEIAKDTGMSLSSSTRTTRGPFMRSGLYALIRLAFPQ
jgi:hypothetical protein